MTPRRQLRAVAAAVVMFGASGCSPDVSSSAADRVLAFTEEAPTLNEAQQDSSETGDQSLAGCAVEYPDAETSPYRLPFPVGTAYPTGLANCSSSFHQTGQPDQFAYDFNLPLFEQVVAAREGTVTFVQDTDPNGGGSAGGNQVNIDHGDGTTGVYLHFSPDTISVAVGDVVNQGDGLGAIGFSGTSAGYPHLHFIVVDGPGVYPWRGVPIVFRNAEPPDAPLASNQPYLATSD